jgi:tetratricopeptide (TPR) repeat protein
MRPPVLLFLLLTSIFSYVTCLSAEKETLNIKNPQLNCVTQATQSLIAWNEFLRNDLEALHQDGWYIYSLGMQEHNEFVIHVGKRSLGSYFIRSGKIDNGILLLKAAANYFERAGNYEVLTETFNEIGNGYVYKSEPINAISFFMRSLKTGKKSDDPTSVFLAEINLAQAYLQMKQFDKAQAILQNYKTQALHFKKFEAVSSAYALLGTIAQANQKMALAKEFFLKSAKFGFRSNSNSLIGQAYTNFAIALFLENKIDLAKSYFEKALFYRLKTNNGRSIAESYFNLGDYYSQTANQYLAINYFKKSLNIAKKNELFQDQIDALLALKECYIILNDQPNQLLIMNQLVECQQQKLNYSVQLMNQDNAVEQLVYEDKINYQAFMKIKQLNRYISEKNNLIFIFSLLLGVFFIGSIILMATQSIQTSRDN